ncbi:MAG: rRNA small subunit methyltransferase 1 [Bifidobacteriaceae bacterium]|jgi:16S rRNA (cytidine1402-2'-O)-methyltransferase|nr:rRNA small subunit methyltransferase 1 [Bifidobacteriaceae bacterium]
MALAATGIVLAATPIGDPADASEHLRRLLASADLIAAEDTRRLRQLAARLGVKIGGRVLSFYDHNERSRLDLLLAAARAGLVVVVSDAGLPLLSDPGFALVRAAIAEGVPVTCAPGPSAVLTALVLSGLPTDRFAFDGFVPRAAGARSAWLGQVAAEPRTVVVFESARRLAQTLSDAVRLLGPDRPAALARELTKPHQELIRGPLGELADAAAARELKGEVTLVIGGARRASGTGGASGTDRASGTAGAASAGGASGTGGAASAGGANGTGGAASADRASGTGGAASAGGALLAGRAAPADVASSAGSAASAEGLALAGELVAAVEALVADGAGLKQAAAAVAETAGRSRRLVYQAVLAARAAAAAAHADA